MSKGFVCEAGRHPVTFATLKSLHYIVDNTNSTAGESLCVWVCVFCGSISLNEAVLKDSNLFNKTQSICLWA